MGRLAAAVFLLVAAVREGPAEERWYTLSANGQRTGYAHELRQSDGDALVTNETVTIFVRDIAHQARIERHIEFRRSAAGTPVSYGFSYSAGVERSSWQGTFDGTKLAIRFSDGRTRTVDLPDDTVFDPDPATRFGAMWNRPSELVDLTVFDPVRASAGLLRLRGVASDGGALSHVRAIHGASGDDADDVWFDASGRIERMETTIPGARLAWTPCERDCDARVEHPMDPMLQLVVRSPVRIPAWLKHRTLRYVIARADGIQPQLIETGEQSMVRDGTRAIVTICTQCGTAEHPDAAELRRYGEPNSWVRSDAPEIRNLALDASPRGMRTDLRMERLARLVAKRMHGNNDFVGYADAVTALRTGSGDCTEFAVLLAALARAQDIPVRIVVGLAYADRFSGKKDVFSPHMWVQAWDGTAWKSYDAALDGFDSTHIALGIGAGDPADMERLMAQLPLLRIEKAGVVRGD